MYTNAQQKEYYELSKTLLDKNVDIDDVTDLRDAIIYHEWKYYIGNDPVISDYEFDVLFQKLQKLEKDNPLLITPDSPTQRVSSDISQDFSTVVHLIPMLSLGNSYNAEDLFDFDKQVKKLCKLDSDSVVEYAVEPKYDGGSVAIVYENDIMVRAATSCDHVHGVIAVPRQPDVAIFLHIHQVPGGKRHVIDSGENWAAWVLADGFIIYVGETQNLGEGGGGTAV